MIPDQRCVYQIPRGVIQGCYSKKCYSYWKLIDDTDSPQTRFLPHGKGCWTNDPNSECKSKLFNNDLLFCCCDGDLCNKDLDPDACYRQLTPTPAAISTETINLLCFLVLAACVPAIAYFLIKLLFRKKQPNGQWNSNDELYRNNRVTYEEKRFDWKKENEKLLKNCDESAELIEYRARGRYGDIYQGRLAGGDALVAIKIFQQADYESFKNELKIYKLPGLEREANILRFIRAEVRSDNLINASEYWLITEWQEHGSLQEYLAGNLLDERQIVSVCLDIANGLAFLHGYGRCNRQIAHRDFKSSNILLNGQLHACIADFGLALVFFNHKLESDTLNQVGTSRYFSPELLDGAINFSGDSLLKVDIWACALVFWECLSRCNKLQSLNTVKEYKLPFEIEFGSMPSINELRNFISLQQRRPVIEPHWRSNRFLAAFCQTIEDCWCNDAECRLTASCISERLKSFKKLVTLEHLDL